MDINTRLTYAIFFTSTGKGYACFAIRHEAKSKEYFVSGAFCSPKDRVVFSKSNARNCAINRLNDPKWVTKVYSDQNDFELIIKKAMLQNDNTPPWALKSIKNNGFSHTLTDDFQPNIVKYKDAIIERLSKLGV